MLVKTIESLAVWSGRSHTKMGATFSDKLDVRKASKKKPSEDCWIQQRNLKCRSCTKKDGVQAVHIKRVLKRLTKEENLDWMIRFTKIIRAFQWFWTIAGGKCFNGWFDRGGGLRMFIGVETSWGKPFFINGTVVKPKTIIGGGKKTRMMGFILCVSIQTNLLFWQSHFVLVELRHDDIAGL